MVTTVIYGIYVDNDINEKLKVSAIKRGTSVENLLKDAIKNVLGRSNEDEKGEKNKIYDHECYQCEKPFSNKVKNDKFCCVPCHDAFKEDSYNMRIAKIKMMKGVENE